MDREYRSREDQMAISKTLYVTSREERRAWLADHYDSETEVIEAGEV